MEMSEVVNLPKRNESIKKIRGLEDGMDRCMTPKQKVVFLCIDEYWKRMGYGPSIDDIMRMTGDRGRGNVNRVMSRLCDLGICKKLPRRPRSIRPVYINFRSIE